MCPVQPIALASLGRLYFARSCLTSLLILAKSASNQSSDIADNYADIVLQTAECDRCSVFSGHEKSLLSSWLQRPVFSNQSRGSVPVMCELLTFA